MLRPLFAVLLAGPALAAPPLEPDVIRVQVARVREALDQAYAGKIFRTPETWASVVAELDRLAERRLDGPGLCAGLGDALAGLHDPAVFAFDKSGRCSSTLHLDRRVAALPVEPNVARDAARTWLLQREAQGVVVLGIRSFDAPGAKWDGFEAASATVASAAAAVVDLRDARGEDPRGALPLLRTLTEYERLTPLRAVVTRDGPLVERLLQRARDEGMDPPRPQAAWREFVGEEPTAGKPVTKPLAVLVGGSCESACEFVARTLQTYARATVLGQVGSERRLAAASLGVLELDVAGIRLALPTAAYQVHANIEQQDGIPGRWLVADRGQAPLPARAVALQVAQLHDELQWAEEDRRWVARPPPACGTFSAVSTWQKLPAEAQPRLFAAMPRFVRFTLHATLHLPPEDAVAYVDGCPGLHAVAREPHRSARSSIVTIAADSYGALTRLAQSPAVVTIARRRDREDQLDAR